MNIKMDKKYWVVLFIMILIFSGCTNQAYPEEQKEPADEEQQAEIQPDQNLPETMEPETPDTDQTVEGYKEYMSTEGWSFRYPETWDKVEENFIQETATGKTVVFSSETTTKQDLEVWIQSEIKRKLEAEEADNTLTDPLSINTKDDLTVYRYTINSKMESTEAFIPNVIFFDGERKYTFYTNIPPVTEEEFETILDSFKPIR